MTPGLTTAPPPAFTVRSMPFHSHGPSTRMGDMTQDAWTAVDEHLTAALHEPDSHLEAVLRANAAAGLPAIDVSPGQGKLLMLLTRLANARSVLEIGTLGGYSTIWFARALPEDAHVVTLEVNDEHARVARANIDRVGFGRRVDIRVGPALETLPTLLDRPPAPFDVVFLDADKPNNPQYLDWALRLSRTGTLLIADNVVRGGAVAEPAVQDPSTVGSRVFLDKLGADPRVTATALQTVGVKGWDGFALALVTDA